MTTLSLWLRRSAVVLAAACAAVAVPAGSAGAHAFLTSSVPADGSALTRSPAQLQLRFSESIEQTTTSLVVVGADGVNRQPTNVQVVRGDAAGPVLLTADLPALPTGAYRVSWQTVSSDDLHRTSGVLVFGVQQQVTAAGLHESPPVLTESALRWVLFLALALALGATMLASLYRPDRDGPFTDAAMRHCRDLALAGSVAAIAVSAGLLAQQAATSHESIAKLLPSSYGNRWLLREAGLVLLALVLWARARHGNRSAARPGAVLRALTVVAAVTTAVGFALLGHAANGASLSPTRIAADAAHLTAAALWSGTLMAAVAVVLPRLRASGGEAVAARCALRRFLVPATACVAVMGVTGVYLASGVVGSVDALIATTYGQVLIAKLVLVAVAGVLGLANSAALHPRGAAALRAAVGWRVRAQQQPQLPRRPRLLAAEAVVAVTVLAMSALLTSGQPAREPQLVRSVADRAVPVVDGAADDLQETFALKPNLPGANVLLVGVFDTRRPSPGRVRGVEVTVGTAAPVTLTALGDGSWSAPVNLAGSGAEQVAVTVHRDGLPEAHAGYRWVVGGAPDQTRKAVISTEPLAGPLRVAAAGLAALVLLMGAAGLLVRSRRRPVVAAPAAGVERVAESVGTRSG